MKKYFSVYVFMILSLTSCTLTTSHTPAPATIQYMHCFITFGSRIHTTDVFYFNNFASDETIHIFAPVGGLVTYLADGPYMIGENIIVKTDYVYQKERVYYQLTRFHEMKAHMSVGDRINQGDTIGYIDNDGHPSDSLNGYILDISFFVAKPYLYDHDPGNSADIEKYIDPGLPLGDSLEKFPIIYHMPRCEGDPIINP